MAKPPVLINPLSCIDHDTGPGHPERPARLSSIFKHFENTGMSEECQVATARSATLEELALAHPIEHVRAVQTFIEEGGQALDADTIVSSHSLPAAYLAAGAALTGIELLQANTATRIFCGVRPPGHHAEAHRSMGFCLFNNAAIAARYAQKTGLAERVLILDWDVHHGNGTQDIFWEDPTVFYYSLHQYPFYPGTGSAGETGAGPGLGFTLNRPLPAQTGDSTYLKLLEKDLDTIAHQFKPQLVIISAGFDAHRDDPLGGINLSTHAFTQMTQSVLNMAEHCAKGRVLSLLEGGYDLQALADSAGSHVEAMLTTPGQ